MGKGKFSQLKKRMRQIDFNAVVSCLPLKDTLALPASIFFYLVSLIKHIACTMVVSKVRWARLPPPQSERSPRPRSDHTDVSDHRERRSSRSCRGCRSRWRGHAVPKLNS